MKFYLNIFLLIYFGISLNYFAQNEEINSSGIKHTIHSRILGEDREYLLSLPESYNTGPTAYKKYPVLIVLDGGSHFKTFSSMANYMSTNHNGSRQIPEMIIAAVLNVNRERDFTPDKIITKRENSTGGGMNFLNFIENELIKELDEKYSTMPYRILAGHSLGGLFASYSYLEKESKFNSFIVIDPSFGTWDDKTMDKKIENSTEKSFDRFLYIASSNWGKRNFGNRDRHIRFYESLQKICPGNDFNAKIKYFKNENHHSVPVPAFYNGISAIFKGYGISYRDIESREQLIEHFNKISRRLSYNFPPPEELVDRLGYRLLRGSGKEMQKEAIDYLILNTVNYPDSYNAFDSLGEAYAAIGDTINAKLNYKNSLEINPENERAKRFLRGLSDNN